MFAKDSGSFQAGEAGPRSQPAGSRAQKTLERFASQSRLLGGRLLGFEVLGSGNRDPALPGASLKT